MKPLLERIPLWGNGIRFVLLDMDGTLLDKYFDDYFWEHLVPERYAEKRGIPFATAKDELLLKYSRHAGTLNWTDIDFWSGELDLDIPTLKEQIKHLIDVHPYVEDFLKRLKDHGKEVFLVTNAHLKVLDLKMKKTDLGRYFDACITSSETGYPKEDLRFWKTAQDSMGFERDRTLFIDDTHEILETARRFGIRYVLYKTGASSRGKSSASKDFLTVADFEELIP